MVVSKRNKAPKKQAKKAAAGQKEMLMPIGGKKPAKEALAKKPTAKEREVRLMPGGPPCSVFAEADRVS